MDCGLTARRPNHIRPRYDDGSDAPNASKAEVTGRRLRSDLSASDSAAMDDAMAYLETKRRQMHGMQQAQALAALQMEMAANLRERMQQLEEYASMRSASISTSQPLCERR
eukprot:SAG31_NODE_4055_length_3633_cov_1.566497_4_plen_111_part_00